MIQQLHTHTQIKQPCYCWENQQPNLECKRREDSLETVLQTNNVPNVDKSKIFIQIFEAKKHRHLKFWANLTIIPNLIGFRHCGEKLTD